MRARKWFFVFELNRERTSTDNKLWMCSCAKTVAIKCAENKTRVHTRIVSVVGFLFLRWFVECFTIYIYEINLMNYDTGEKIAYDFFYICIKYERWLLSCKQSFHFITQYLLCTLKYINGVCICIHSQKFQIFIFWNLRYFRCH